VAERLGLSSLQADRLNVAKPPAPRCGATNRQGKPCGALAGAGTDHLGQGRCKFHGGANPIRSGRYSKVDRPRIRELYEEFATDPDPLDVIAELHMARALLRDYLERYDEWKEAFLAWHLSFRTVAEQENPKPREVLDLADAVRIIDTISKVVSRIEKVRSDSAISRKDFFRLVSEYARIVEARVGDDQVLEQIKNDWLQVRLA
jgi:hypothetical protein